MGNRQSTRRCGRALPIFLFASGYLTARSGQVPLWKRLKAALIPYAIAFVAAYIYMALHNPAMDHRVITTVARFVLAYVFVYYYVFVYVGCTVVPVVGVFGFPHRRAGIRTARLAALLLLSIALRPDRRKLSRSAAAPAGLFGLRWSRKSACAIFRSGFRSWRSGY